MLTGDVCRLTDPTRTPRTNPMVGWPIRPPPECPRGSRRPPPLARARSGADVLEQASHHVAEASDFLIGQPGPQPPVQPYGGLV